MKAGRKVSTASNFRDALVLVIIENFRFDAQNSGQGGWPHSIHVAQGILQGIIQGIIQGIYVCMHVYHDLYKQLIKC